LGRGFFFHCSPGHVYRLAATDEIAYYVGAETATLQLVLKISANGLGDKLAGAGTNQPGERLDQVSGFWAVIRDRDSAAVRTETWVPGQQPGEMFAQNLHALLYWRPEHFFHMTPWPIFKRGQTIGNLRDIVNEGLDPALPTWKCKPGL
jgi:hypothetical protein